MSGVTLTSLPSVLMLTRGDGWLQEALGAPPSAARSFVIGDHIRAGVEVYVPGSLAADLEVASHVSWPDGTRSGATRRKIARGTGQARTDELTFAIDTTAFPPGRYVLHVTLDPSGAAKSERQVPFEVVR